MLIELFVVLLATNPLTLGFVVDSNSALSLYSADDHVVELLDSNITSIYKSNNIWLVEFYNHWCGHCRRFVPTWQALAKDLKDMSQVKVAAINCATQNCSPYQITSTPTIKIMNPMSQNFFGDMWKEIAAVNDIEVYKNAIREELTTLNTNIPRNSPVDVSPMAYEPQPGTYQYGPRPVLPYPTSPDAYPSRPDTGNQLLPSKPSITVVQSTQRDQVYQGDLEKAIQYAFTKEIANGAAIGNAKLRALMQFADVIINFLPNLRQPIRKFLISLREWPIFMEYHMITGKQYKDKIAELQDFYQPFASTPSEWVACKGSEETLRGYPCSLWTLFHTLSVNGAEKDLSYMYGTASIISKAMVGYITQFFSCRECAANFQDKINSLGYLPQAGNDTVIWIWTIHNIANRMLVGDETEDPQFPKVQWPSAENCPNCRFVNTFHHYNGYHQNHEETWNVPAVLKYMHEVYGASQINNNIYERSGMDVKGLINMVKTKASQNKIIKKVEDMCSSF